MSADGDPLDRLRAGNRRFLSGETTAATGRGPDGRPPVPPQRMRAALAGGQSPYAVVLACADSRVAPEVLFDAQLGELFVVRVAGNVAEPTQVGSIEFAVEQLGAGLVMVLGHTACGAVGAAVDTLSGPSGHSDDLESILSVIRPVARAVKAERSDADAAALAGLTVRANARAAANALRAVPALASRVADGRLRVVAAEYALDTGAVDIFDLG